jgi:apolipoprotein N-acyltransferase
LWLAGQQPGFFALGWIALTPLFWAITGLNSRSRWRLGYLIGWCTYALCNWWIVPAIIKGGGLIGAGPLLGALLGILAVTLIGLIHGLQVAIVARLWDPAAAWSRRRPWLLPLVAALVWTLCDALRSQSALAHSWGALGYTQWRDTALLQTAAILGQHGLTALCVWFAASMALWLRQLEGELDGDRRATLWRLPVLVFIVLHGVGTIRLWNYDRRNVAQAQSVNILAVQTDVPSLAKNRTSTAYEETPFGQAETLTSRYFAAHRDPAVDLVLWPETTSDIWRRSATSAALRDDRRGWEMVALDRLAQTHRVAILTGATSSTAQRELFNEALLVRPEGTEGHIAKNRLVPFGERAPFSEWLPFLSHFAPEPPMVAGTNDEPMLLRSGAAHPIKIGTLICFESCFGNPARELCHNGADLLVTLTNDEWCAGTNAPWDHAVMSAMRAVENGVPVVQVANGGYTAVFDPCGRFVYKSPFGQRLAVPATVMFK